MKIVSILAVGIIGFGVPSGVETVEAGGSVLDCRISRAEESSLGVQAGKLVKKPSGLGADLIDLITLWVLAGGFLWLDTKGEIAKVASNLDRLRDLECICKEKEKDEFLVELCDRVVVYEFFLNRCDRYRSKEIYQNLLLILNPIETVPFFMIVKGLTKVKPSLAKKGLKEMPERLALIPTVLDYCSGEEGYRIPGLIKQIEIDIEWQKNELEYHKKRKDD